MRIIVENEASITVLEVQTVEHTKDSDTITVFDYNDNSGKIKVKDSYAIRKVVQDLKNNTNGVIKIQGEVIWD